MHKAIPIYTDDEIPAIMRALADGFIIRAPGSGIPFEMAAGYKIGSRRVEFLIPAYVFSGLRATLEHDWSAVDLADVIPRMAYIEEPGWPPGWCAVSPENDTAMLLQVRHRRVFDLFMDKVMST